MIYYLGYKSTYQMFSVIQENPGWDQPNKRFVCTVAYNYANFFLWF